jgi:phospholipase/carboxylesterase
MLDCVEIAPKAAHVATVVWLHGLGASGHDFEPIVPYLRLPAVRFVFPHAPMRPVTINGGYVMPSWYDIRTLDFTANEREDRAQIAETTTEIEALLAREEARIDRVVLMGFSQGGAMALHVGHRHRTTLRGIAVLSGYLVAPERVDAEAAPENATTPLMFMHGRHDNVVPPFAGRLTYERFATPGRDVRWKEYPMGHEVCPPQIVDIAAWLSERVAG